MTALKSIFLFFLTVFILSSRVFGQNNMYSQKGDSISVLKATSFLYYNRRRGRAKAFQEGDRFITKEMFVSRLSTDEEVFDLYDSGVRMQQAGITLMGVGYVFTLASIRINIRKSNLDMPFGVLGGVAFTLGGLVVYNQGHIVKKRAISIYNKNIDKPLGVRLRFKGNGLALTLYF